MKKQRICLLLTGLLLVSLCLSACGVQPTQPGETVFVEQLPMPAYQSGQTVTLNVYNWGEYISDGEDEGTLDVNQAFEEYFNANLSEKYGGIRIRVEYSTYATNEDMYAKLKNSAVSYDIVIPSDYMIEKMKNEHMLLGFDTASLSNYKNISPDFQNTYYDPSNAFSVPYTYGMVGIIYNKALVREEDVRERSWDLLWNPDYAGNILQFNNPRDAFATALYRLQMDVNASDPNVWNEALEQLKAQKPLLQGYVNDEIFNKMQTESAAIAPYYVGDFLTMAEEEENLDFYFPKEGTNYFIDAMCIPSCAKNPHLAKEYINFMIGEEAAVANAQYIGYASPNTAVINNADYIAYMGEYAYTDSEGNGAYELLYAEENTPEVVNAGYNAKFPDKDDPACYRDLDKSTQAHTNTLWESLKIEGSTELWVHIAAGTITGSVLAFAVYTTYIKKKRSKDYRLRDRQRAKQQSKTG